MTLKKFSGRWLFLCLFLSAAILVGWSLSQSSFGEDEDRGGEDVHVVARGNLEDVVTAQGKLEPKSYVDVGAQVSGQIKTLAVEVGATVKAGDLIAEIDPEVFETRVAADEARLKTLQAQKQQLEAESQSARQKLKRAQVLSKENAISKELLEDAQTALRVADAKILSLDAQIEESVSTLEGDKASLSYTKIYAPMDGTVVSQSVREGQTVNANQTAPTIVQVADLDTMTVKAQVAEADIMKLKEGMMANFTTLGAPDRKWEGVVRQILPSPEVINDVVLYSVLLDADNKDRKLMSGMSTQVFFVAAKAENVLLIPVTALTRKISEQGNESGDAYVVKVRKGGAVEDRTVMVGLMDRSMAEIRQGLLEGDRVVLSIPKSTSKQPQNMGRFGGPRL